MHSFCYNLTKGERKKEGKGECIDAWQAKLEIAAQIHPPGNIICCYMFRQSLLDIVKKKKTCNILMRKLYEWERMGSININITNKEHEILLSMKSKQ